MGSRPDFRNGDAGSTEITDLYVIVRAGLSRVHNRGVVCIGILFPGLVIQCMFYSNRTPPTVNVLPPTPIPRSGSLVTKIWPQIQLFWAIQKWLGASRMGFWISTFVWHNWMKGRGQNSKCFESICTSWSFDSTKWTIASIMFQLPAYLSWDSVDGGEDTKWFGRRRSWYKIIRWWPITE